MKSLGLVAAIAVIVFGVVGLFSVGMYFSYNNEAIRYETNIKKADDSIGVIFSNFSQGVKELSQVTTMQTEDVGKVFKDAMQGRYGEDGSKAVFQFIKEQNPNLNSEVYVKIQQYIEGKRNDLVFANQKLIDNRANYTNALGSLPGRWFFHMAGYPTIDLEKQYLPIETKGAQDMLKTGTEGDPIKLR